MSFTIIRNDKHVVKKTIASNFFSRALKCRDIMTFFHLETGQWILGCWLHKNSKVVEEIEDLGPHMEAMSDPSFVKMIRQGWGGVDWKALKRRYLHREKEKITKEAEEIIQDQDRWDWAKKKNPRVPIPYMVDCGKMT